MYVEKILYQLLNKSIHKTRIKSLSTTLLAIIKSKQLSLTRLGRSLEIKGKERAGIRRVDRLLANKYYQNRSIEIYKAITRWVVNNQGRPIILVDWTGIPNSKLKAKKGEHSAIRASIIAEGRSITLYEEVHPKKKEASAAVHNSFLTSLASILPSGCCPYVVTDSGFRNPWFRAIQKLGWDYIGRVRGGVKYDDGSGFKLIEHLFPQATSTPKKLGAFVLAKTRPLNTNGYIYKHKLMGRKKLTKTGNVDKHKDSKSHSRSYREPWILVSSISSFSAANRVIKMYKMRMTIESSFRDTKSTEFGLNLNENITIKAERYSVWLMLATVASFIAWVVGYAAERKNLHYSFQANTYRHRRVLSFFYLGCQVIRKKVRLNIVLEEIRRNTWDFMAWEILCDEM